ncbi:MAG: glutamate-5-semialdehyde dehydrogenase [Nitrospinae bacterium]|nr:glutamate-5-semialdehyde dehydrogenase [Nitrospinota bacterium]MBL7020222.1 glutamate-5-semialdehyde dehydrogenase [Nitrospinaceae bacterium]
MKITEIAKNANASALILAHLSTDLKNQALQAMADALEENCAAILAANEKDLEFAKKEGIASALIARLALNEDKVRGMAKGIRSVVALPDPVGRVNSVMEMDQDLVVKQVTCPIGVIGAIFESRPDAVPQISSLCLKSGNAVILKGGTEAQNSNKVIVKLLVEAIGKVPGVPASAVQMIETRSEVADMLKEDKYIHLIVPRGSNAFVKYIQENTRIPVLGHSEGVCHGYVDKYADLDKSLRICLDSKLQYPAACNAMETLLVHKDFAAQVLPDLLIKFKENHVELVGCVATCKVVPEVTPASESDWDMEYNDLKLSIKIVEGLSDAVKFINKHGSGHTDVIITENRERAERFLNEVSSSSVMWNASTRFADGFRYGLGAEIGISTNRTHARGPVGLEGLIIYKYKLYGDGQVAGDYSGANAREFTHKSLGVRPDSNGSV